MERGRGRGEREGKGGEGLVLRPTPRSMLPSEVPVGGGCAEFPTVRTSACSNSSRLFSYGKENLDHRSP